MQCPVHSISTSDDSHSLFNPHQAPSYSKTKLKQEAKDFLKQYYNEKSLTDFESRLQKIIEEIDHSGTYRHTPDELEYGAKLAWRNSNKCIGRLFWKSLKVNDCRHLNEAESITRACVDHMEQAYNDGQIQSLITIFEAQQPSQNGITIYNHQIVRYAGFEQKDGSIIGDPESVRLTNLAQSLGWEPEKESPFEILPLIVQLPGEEPALTPLPDRAIHEVALSHPDFKWFTDLGLRWYAVPALSDMRLEIGGLHYTAAPFNGWYMGTEIGARNFGDPHRYDMLPTIAKEMGLDTARPDSLWKDRALVALNRAVLYSYNQAGVKIVDHHTASEQFMHHKQIEANKKRELSGDWDWLVPPLSGSASPLFFEEMDDKIKKPNFFYQG